MSGREGRLITIKEIEENMKRSQTIGDEVIKDVWMTYVSPDEVRFLLARIAALEGVVECAKRWSDTEARWQAHLTHCDKCQNQVMCSEEWLDISFAVIQAWKDTWEALSKLKKLEEAG